MNPQRFALVAVLFLSAAYASQRIAWFSGSGSAGAASSGKAHVIDSLAPALAANVAAAGTPVAPMLAAGDPAIASADAATAAELLAEVAVPLGPAPEKHEPIVVAALSDPSEVLLKDAATLSAAASTPAIDAEAGKHAPVTVATISDPLEILLNDAAALVAAARTPAPPRLEIVGECLDPEPCIDQYLFALYERTPKLDTIKETERRKVTVKRKGKRVTVTRSFTRRVDNDFTWKDPKAAERVDMSMIDYVIGGMDKSFKWKLFYMLQAAEDAGLSPGITSAFRDDYRQSIASGMKAASDRSYHGGSFRGGYGHGLAADIVSTKGATRAQRWVSTEALWKWVDANGKEFGIGRPYLDRDPPHVGPVDGQEYVSRRGGTKQAASDVKKRQLQATQAKPTPKRPVATRSSKGRAT